METSSYSRPYVSDDAFINDLWRLEHDKARTADEADKRSRDRLTLAAREVLGSENGRRLLFWLLNRTGVFASSFTGNSSTFFLEGKRSIGIELYRLLLSADQNAIHSLITFQKNEDTNESGNE